MVALRASQNPSSGIVACPPTLYSPLAGISDTVSRSLDITSPYAGSRHETLPSYSYGKEFETALDATTQKEAIATPSFAYFCILLLVDVLLLKLRQCGRSPKIYAGSRRSTSIFRLELALLYHANAYSEVFRSREHGPSFLRTK
jgi:hypothetical protein